MRMTLHTDYALRMLIFLAVRPDAPCTVSDVAEAHGLSHNHLLKVARRLRQMGVISTLRGRTGGIFLAQDPESIALGTVVREMEGSLALVECMGSEASACVLTPACRLKGIVTEALDAWLAVFDRYTLADLVTNRQSLAGLLGLDLPASGAVASA
ncbi:Rrf2 family transcriptional regulator (plasmid) [Nitratireductor sp. GISD-1A_MAKvit]|uniref:Rrf2 family transcriptional regulator n=1 Tax=Nitratireductor sp. GISD-1A_MAKvit TaxID=3234198 RepID=UPI0034658093